MLCCAAPCCAALCRDVLLLCCAALCRAMLCLDGMGWGGAQLPVEEARLDLAGRHMPAESWEGAPAPTPYRGWAPPTRPPPPPPPPPAQVPYWQSKIVQGCRRRGKPCIVATNMLESMIQNPTPTRWVRCGCGWLAGWLRLRLRAWVHLRYKRSTMHFTQAHCQQRVRDSSAHFLLGPGGWGASALG